MPRTGLSATLDRVRRAVAPDAAPSDGHLLTRFVQARDEAAFAELVRRHGPMVLAVCRRTTGDRHAAEDAFQAVFLTLARRADRLAGWESVGGWLRQVARRVAANARRAAARQRGREVPLAGGGQEPPARPDEPADAFGPVALEELARLPDRFRVLLVLHYLEGRPQTEVAVRLGLPAGTVNRRMSEARAALGDRLRARGVAPGLAVLGGVLVPADSAARAVAAAVSPNAVPAAVAALSNGAMRTMILHKLTLAAAGGLLLAAVTAGGLVASAEGPAAADPAPAARPAAPAPAAPRPDDPKLKAAPPVVVKTVPEAGADDIDPATTAVQVTFSKPMTDKSWTWSTTPPEYGDMPEVVGKPAVAFDKGLKTCTLGVKLEPNKTYAIWVNSDRFQNFKDADGNPVVPYLLVFRTKAK